MRASGRGWIRGSGRCRSTGAYVVPRSPWRLDGSLPKRGEPYSRRGLRHHTVLPMEVGGLRVRPVHLPTGPLPGGRLALGAALFRQPELQLRAVEDGPHGRGFLAEGFTAADMEATIARQAAAAFADGCFAAVWPELTMPPDARQALARQLAFEALRHGSDAAAPPRRRGLLARATGGGRLEQPGPRPRPHRRGAVLLRQVQPPSTTRPGARRPSSAATSCRSSSPATSWSASPSARISATARWPRPSPNLPVDLILVPSLGRASTLAGHLANAEDLRLRTGTIVFVVQQLPGTTADPAQAGEEILGHVLLSRRKAAAGAAGEHLGGPRGVPGGLSGAPPPRTAVRPAPPVVSVRLRAGRPAETL